MVVEIAISDNDRDPWLAAPDKMLSAQLKAGWHQFDTLEKPLDAPKLDIRVRLAEIVAQNNSLR